MIPKISDEWMDEAVAAIGTLVEKAEDIWEVAGFIRKVDILVWRASGAVPKLP